jgi:hypothetical protein
MNPGAQTIISHCRTPGVYLRKSYRNAKGGGRKRGGGRQIETEFFLEPGGVLVEEQYALEAIASGKLIVRDWALFDDDPAGAQSWFLPLKRAKRAASGTSS